MLAFDFNDFMSAYTPEGYRDMPDPDFDRLCDAQDAKVAWLAASPCWSREDAIERLKLATYFASLKTYQIGLILGPAMDAVLEDLAGAGLRLASIVALREALAFVPAALTPWHEEWEKPVVDLCRSALTALVRPAAVAV